MRIFLVMEAFANAQVPGNQTWRRNFYESLVELGHEVVLFSTEDGRRAMQRRDLAARAEFSQKLLDAFYAEHTRKRIDLFFTYLMDGMVEPGIIDQIRKTGIPTCNFSCNNSHQFYLVDELSPHYDYCLHTEKDAREKFLKVGATPLWWPMASNPKYFKPLDVPRTLAGSFVGANYALRASYLLHLLENGIDVHAFGPDWQWGHVTRLRAHLRHYRNLLRILMAFSPSSQYQFVANMADQDLRRFVGAKYPQNVHAPVSDDEQIALYSRSHISLGFLEVYDQHDASHPVTQHLHLREFEAPMSGALYCTGYMDELAEMFELDKEVVVYRNRHELLDKMRYYLSHPNEADRIRAAGLSRALRCHTYQQRFRTLFLTLGLEE